MRLIQLNYSFRQSYEPHTATFQLPQSCFGNFVLGIPLRHFFLPDGRDTYAAIPALGLSFELV
jgi:hypothetical protein